MHAIGHERWAARRQELSRRLEQEMQRADEIRRAEAEMRGCRQRLELIAALERINDLQTEIWALASAPEL